MHIDDWKNSTLFRLKKILFVILIIMVLLIGCQDKPQQTADVVPIVPTQTTEVLPQPNPAVATELAIEALEATPTPTTQPTEIPAPQQCIPPEGWVVYTIQQGDTLQSLANATRVEIADIKAANCMLQDVLIAGENLYLPFLPPPPPPPPAPVVPAPPITAEPPEPPETGCTTPFNCPNPDLNTTLVIDPGGGNDPTFVPCAVERAPEGGNPWIDTETPDLEHGQRAYFFACAFPNNPVEWTVSAIGPSGSQTKVEIAPILNPDLQMGAAQLVVAWNGTCELPVGNYTLTIADQQNPQNQASTQFELSSPRFQQIMAVPQVGKPGDSFEIYYCGYTSRANQEIEVDIYYEINREENGRYSVALADTWTVDINASGWVSEEVKSLADDPVRAYFINDRDLALEGSVQLWLVTE